MKARLGEMSAGGLLVAVVLLASSPAAGQSVQLSDKRGRASQRGESSLALRITDIPTLRVTTNGRIVEYRAPGAAAIGTTSGVNGCGERTYTDLSNFTATTPVELSIQAGMVDGETAYVSFPIDPSLFPIRFEAAEAVFAQDHSFPTITQWTMLLWDGPPLPQEGGMEMILFSSDGTLAAPHINLPAANEAQAIAVRVEVDPADPDQILLFNDSGYDMITVGFRIDALSNPPSDPCLEAPDPSINAFLVTDTDGILSLSNNWLSAINCDGPCDGTNRFDQLSPLFCLPRGDWVIRATFFCTLTGACCDVDGVCADDVTDRACANQGGTFMGDASICGETICPNPVGVCCFNGGCLEDLETLPCQAITGVYMGNGTACGDVDCTSGACCFPDGSCRDMVDVECADANGSFVGGESCALFTCPQPRGACCIGGQCLDAQQRDTCVGVGGEFAGIDVLCDPDPCATANCPDTLVLAAKPLSGTVDARQPHDPSSALPRQGIGSSSEPILLTLGAEGADIDCFTLCETVQDQVLGPNSISVVTDLGGGDYEIVLDHAITAGGVTTIRYVHDATPVVYTAHPANADGNDFASAADVLAVFGMLTGAVASPHGLYSTDIDHSGAVGAADVIRLIDLLNGAQMFAAWLDTAKPINNTCQ